MSSQAARRDQSGASAIRSSSVRNGFGKKTLSCGVPSPLNRRNCQVIGAPSASKPRTISARDVRRIFFSAGGVGLDSPPSLSPMQTWKCVPPKCTVR